MDTANMKIGYSRLVDVGVVVGAVLVENNHMLKCQLDGSHFDESAQVVDQPIYE
jgi:hypothetical protein